jgi:hypothetical protein
MVQRHEAKKAQGPESPSSILIDNVYLECFLLHIRVLLDFLERSTRSQRKGVELDDVLALDYGLPPQPIGLEHRLRQRLNQDVAHLSYSRTQRQEASKDWFPAAMALPVLARCDAFAAHVIPLGPPTVSEPVRERFEAIRDLITAVTS